MLRKLLCTAVLATATFLGPAAAPSLACPMCKAANETDSNRPRAYMYSILFMLSMPVALFTVFGVGFYRLSQQQPQQHEWDADDTTMP